MDNFRYSFLLLQFYDKLIVSTGNSPTLPLVDGYNLNEVYTLKTYFDNIKIKQSLNHSKNVVIVGSNREALEFTSTVKASNDKLNIFIIDENSKPLANILGEELSKEILK